MIMVGSAARVLKDHGFRFLVLPACSADPNSIEMAFPKSTAHLRRIGARNFDYPVARIEEICGLFSPGEC